MHIKLLLIPVIGVLATPIAIAAIRPCPSPSNCAYPTEVTLTHTPGQALCYVTIDAGQQGTSITGVRPNSQDQAGGYATAAKPTSRNTWSSVSSCADIKIICVQLP